MGASGSAGLSRTAFFLALMAGLSPAAPMHFDRVEGPPAQAQAFEQAIRDTLRARGTDLWSADSLARIQERGEWPTGERTTDIVKYLLTRTKRPSVAWVVLETEQVTVKRTWWKPFWPARIWTQAAIVRSATATPPPKVVRLQASYRQPLGFTGTTKLEMYPASSRDRSEALQALARQLTSRIGQTLAPDSSAPAK